jgi:hypothetical protein
MMDKCHAKGAKEHGGQPMFSIAAINNFVVRDCYFDGDADGDGDGDGSPISMFGVNGGGIFGSEILNSAEAGIRYQAWREGSPDKEFENFTISGNNIHDNAWYGIWARQDTAPADTPFNVCIVNNSIWGSGRNGLKIEVANGLDISGNYIHTNSTSNAGSYAAIELESATDVDAVFDVSVFNNRMYDNGSTQTLGFRIDAAQNIYIGHNTLEDITTVSTITADTANINFAGKTFSSYSDTAFYSGTLERDVSVGSGDVSYTGIGFKPRAIIFYATVASTNTASWGMSAGASNNVMTQMASGSFDYYTGSASIAYVSGLNTHIGTIKTFDSDGFTITWTKANSPTGTLRVYYMAYR